MRSLRARRPLPAAGRIWCWSCRCRGRCRRREGFARGAVGLLGSLGVVTHLSFGSECGELEPLQRVAEALLDPLLGEDLRAELQAGIPFAAARQQAVARRVWARWQSCCRRRTTSSPWSISRRSLTSGSTCIR
ncbi:MAG: nucleotidyltransferase family protein [Oscillospiraceae bacterium]